MVELSLLQKYSEGLIALSGGMEGHVGQSILAGNILLTESRINFFKSIFIRSKERSIFLGCSFNNSSKRLSI